MAVLQMAAGGKKSKFSELADVACDGYEWEDEGPQLMTMLHPSFSQWLDRHPFSIRKWSITS